MASSERFHAERAELNRRSRVVAGVCKLAQSAADPTLAARLARIAADERASINEDRERLIEDVREELRLRFRRRFLLTKATARALADCHHRPQFQALWRQLQHRRTACAKGGSPRPASVGKRRQRRRRPAAAASTRAPAPDPEPARKTDWDPATDPSLFQLYPEVGRHNVRPAELDPHGTMGRLMVREGGQWRIASDVDLDVWPGWVCGGNA